MSTEIFTCAVCYTNGESSGIVIPKSCSHKICLDCYTKIVLNDKNTIRCPECRTFYLKQPVVEDFSTMPPLVSANEIENHTYMSQSAAQAIRAIIDRIENS